MDKEQKDNYKEPSTKKICSMCYCAQLKIDKISNRKDFMKKEIISLGYDPYEKNLPICLNFGDITLHGAPFFFE